MEPQQNAPKTPEHDQSGGCMLRLFWMVIGNILLFLAALAILERPSRMLGFADLFYWMTVACMLAARYIDIRHFDGRTADGQVATMANWRNYALWVCVAAIVLWLAAHALTLHWTEAG
jgi:hypothetical protein